MKIKSGAATVADKEVTECEYFREDPFYKCYWTLATENREYTVSLKLHEIMNCLVGTPPEDIEQFVASCPAVMLEMMPDLMKAFFTGSMKGAAR